MKNKEEKKNRIWVPIVVGALACSAAVGTGVALVHNQQSPKASTVATMSDAADFSGLTTEVTITTEEATTEAAIEASVNESTKPEAVPATTEIGGGKKKAEETTEEQKDNNKQESNSGSQKPSSASNGGSKPSTPATTEAPKPSQNNSSTSNNSSNSGSSKPSSPTTEAPTTQHQHNYNVKVVDKAAWTETVVDQAAYDETVTHPAEYKTVPATQCHTCKQIFTSGDAFLAHDAFNGGWCNSSGGTGTNIKEKVKDEWTETVHHDAVTHTVNHPEEYHYECSCGARK